MNGDAAVVVDDGSFLPAVADAAPDAAATDAAQSARRVIAAPVGGAFLGAWADPALGAQPASIAKLEAILGHGLAIHTSYWGFNAGQMLSTIGSNAAVADDVANGRHPLVSWGCSSAQGTTFQAIADGTYDDVVLAAADAVRAVNAPVFMRPSWEFNLNVDNPTGNPNGNDCYSPGNVGNLAAEEAEYIAYFRHLVDSFAAAGVNNVTWVWCPAVSTKDYVNVPIDAFYPGAAYVDWVGGDTYDKTTQPTRGFVGIWSAFWSHASAFDRPIMICETGESNNATGAYTQQQFFEDAQAALQPNGAFYASAMTRISALVYFDSDPASGDNWSVDSPTDSNGQAAWAAMASLPFFAP